MNLTTRLSVLLLVSTLLMACGGGGGSNPPVNPPSTINPDPTPQPTPDPEPEPEPEPEPKTGFELYKESIEEMVAAVIMLEKIGKSDIKRIPELVADQVTAHGPTPLCGDEACPSEPYVVTMPSGEEITVHQWVDLNGNNQYDFKEEVLVYSYTDFQGMTGGSMGWYDADREMWPFAFGQRYDAHQGYGLRVGDTTTLEYGAILFVRELADSRVEIGDLDGISDPEIPTQTFQRFKNGEHDVALDTRALVESNLTDRDAVDAYIEWFPAFFGGLLQRLESTTTLDFGIVNDELVLEAGSFQYTEQAEEGAAVVTVRMAVDADPAYLTWELDEDGDETFELSGRVAQSDFRFILP